MFNRLEVLDMSECKLVDIGPNVYKLFTLQELLMSNNSIKSIQPEIGKLQ